MTATIVKFASVSALVFVFLFDFLPVNDVDSEFCFDCFVCCCCLFSGILDGSIDGPACIQHCVLPPNSHSCPEQQSEDCLTATIYAPNDIDTTKPPPVMVNRRYKK